MALPRDARLRHRARALEHIRKLRSSGILYQQLERYLGPAVLKIVKAADFEK
jgi:hypothetical protein